ncbi:hypothetical protein OESDEN_10954 [Oesophagostomum dentatum]|uniref:Uncharacterized protein n=1 Tax=Oesophagostomum dentatum TaxID=61180 RepID=A0A0B1T0E6_OESDE|nr:hypothetical protein OESDEN_10954 [Oesophagostomum dentatum]
MDLRSVIVLFFCSLLAVVMGQEELDTPVYTARLPSPYGLGWRNYMMPMYGADKQWISDDIAPSSYAQLAGNDFLSRIERSMTEKMRSLKGRYNNGQIRNILFGK